MTDRAEKRGRFLDYARRIIAGESPDQEFYRDLINLPDQDAFLLCPGADMLREHYFGRTVHLCVICNGKSGRCSEDCSFCSQSVHSRTGINEYPLMSQADLTAAGRRLEDTPVNRFSVVTSGKSLPKEEIRRVAGALARLDGDKIGTCASLGILSEEELRLLKESGVSTYHHNLETAASMFEQMCTTHTYQKRLDTVQAARRAGLSVCCGGVFGLGETDEQILELALALKKLEVDSVPVNFLVPIEGTPAGGQSSLNPMKCLKIIAFLRYVLPDREIIICGGRDHNLRELHPFIFYAGASGIMTGDYLTTRGRCLDDDLALLDLLRMSPRQD
ncbi:MAG: biotin synthase BioB [Desulfosudaceae bacterium]